MRILFLGWPLAFYGIPLLQLNAVNALRELGNEVDYFDIRGFRGSIAGYDVAVIQGDHLPEIVPQLRKSGDAPIVFIAGGHCVQYISNVFDQDPNTFAAMFTRADKERPELLPYNDRILILPHFISQVQSSTPFTDRSGILIGEVSKNINFSTEDYTKWVRPLIDKYALWGYNTGYDYPKPPNGINVMGSLSYGEFVKWADHFRLYLHFSNKASFETVPVEMAGMGIPVISLSMPMALNCTLGNAAFVVDSPSKLEYAVYRLYNDEALWGRFSDAGKAAYKAVSNPVAYWQLQLEYLYKYRAVT